MKHLLALLCLMLAACGTATLPDGTKISGLGQDVAYERSADGSIRYVSTTGPSFAAAATGVTTLGTSLIDAGVTKYITGAYRDVQVIKEKAAGEALVKGTADPNIIPVDPNIIPLDPNKP